MDVDMKESISCDPLSFDLTNGTHFKNVDYTSGLLHTFSTLLGYEEVKEWRRKNEQRVQVCLFSSVYHRTLV
jgi:hypothetical protein